MSMDRVEQAPVFEHEHVQLRHDRHSGLTAIIALHSTALGPAAGGCRRWHYADMQAASDDALRLAEGMTYKNALAGIPFGGGKSVIVADQHQRPSTAQLEKFAEWLNELNGQYITAEDVGMGVSEMRSMAEHTPFVSGLGHGDIGGDPSPKTAYGVFLGLKAAVQHKLGLTQLLGVRVAVQGLGNVGMHLCRLLSRVGAQLWVTDIDPERVNRAVSNYGAIGVAPQELMHVPVEVFAPCALGGVVNPEVAETIDAAVIAGAANNQLLDDACGDILAARGVLYAPDFVINAAGVISVSHEYLTQRGYFAEDPSHDEQAWVGQRIEAIPERLLEILRKAELAGGSTQRVARQQAIQIISDSTAPSDGCRAA